MTRFRTALALVPSLLAGASTSVVPAAGAGHPQEPAPATWTLFRGGVVRRGSFEEGLGSARRPVPAASALLARGDEVRWVGDEPALETLDRGALGFREGDVLETVDLAGGTLLPGLQDAHGHVEGFGATLEEVDLVGCRSFDELVARIAERAATLPSGAWVTGRGWDQTLWPGAAFPHHARLSERVPDHPVFVHRVDGHAAFANHAALVAAGLADRVVERPVTEGGRVHVDDQGLPTGVLVDTAMRLVGRHVPPTRRADRVRRILAAQDALLALGLTCVHDMGVDRETLDIYRELVEQDRLHLRVVAYLWGNDVLGAEDLEGLPLLPDPQDRFCCPGLKLMVDGALGSRGAYLLEPYADEPDQRGLSRFDDAGIARLVTLCAARGLQPAAHAIGDAGNRQVLDAFAVALGHHPGFDLLRPRVEHAQVVAEADWPRFAALRAVPSMQPTHATSDLRWAEERLGPERVRGAYAWRRLGDPRRAPLALGSDFPVERPHPLEGLHAAITRQDRRGAPEGGWLPDQRLTAAEALEGFTWGAAHAVHQEDRRGRLEPGYRLDAVWLDLDPLELGPEDAARLLDARVLGTWVNGVRRHAASAPGSGGERPEGR